MTSSVVIASRLWTPISSIRGSLGNWDWVRDEVQLPPVFGSAHRPCIVCMVGLYARENCVLVHLVVEDFGLVGLSRHCWEDLVVDRLPVVGCCLGSRVGYSWLSLVGYWGLVGWDGFAVQTPILMEQVEQGWGLE